MNRALLKIRTPGKEVFRHTNTIADAREQLRIFVRDNWDRNLLGDRRNHLPPERIAHFFQNMPGYQYSIAVVEGGVDLAENGDSLYLNPTQIRAIHASLRHMPFSEIERQLGISHGEAAELIHDLVMKFSS